jgi:hypothetical protein
MVHRAALALSLSFGIPAAGACLFTTSEAHASVSVAVMFDALVKESSAVAIVTPVEQKSVWENGRIYTYTRVHADEGVAGDLTTGGEAWIRTMGGVVGHIGQSVDGEPVLTVGRPSLLFLHAGPPGALEVSARAQGQFPITVDDAKQQHLIRSSAVGVLLPPKQASGQPASPSSPPLGPTAQAGALVLAHEVLHNRPLREGLRDVSVAWKRLHAAK